MYAVANVLQIESGESRCFGFRAVSLGNKSIDLELMLDIEMFSRGKSSSAHCIFSCHTPHGSAAAPIFFKASALQVYRPRTARHCKEH